VPGGHLQWIFDTYHYVLGHHATSIDIMWEAFDFVISVLVQFALCHWMSCFLIDTWVLNKTCLSLVEKRKIMRVYEVLAQPLPT
jgi:hypothetical protein